MSGKWHCRTLGRIHLAAMKEFGQRRLLTNDTRQAEAAAHLGYDIVVPHSGAGVMRFLLCIRSPEHPATHPLRGAVFEAWVVSEIYKTRANRGQTLSLSHYRETPGPEVDWGDGLIALSIPSRLVP